MAARPLRLLSLLACLILGGCLSLHREPPKPGATKIGSTPVKLPARIVGSGLVIEAKWDKSGPYHFLIDTGSSVVLVTPEFAAKYAETGLPPPQMPQVTVVSSAGTSTVLPATTVSRIELGSARFEHIPALVYDCSGLSNEEGIKIDAVLGFPLFRETLLTLDYPHNEVVLAKTVSSADGVSPPAPPGSTLDFSLPGKTPVVLVSVGGRTFNALIDSGSEDALSLNAKGWSPHFASGPAEGLTVGTVGGAEMQQVGRLADSLRIGQYTVPRPVTEITDTLSAIGAGILKYFTVTFDQENNRVTFFRDSAEPIQIPGIRSTGLSFERTPAYWKVVGVVPGSPADASDAEPGDLVTRINGEPVSKWDDGRYSQLLDTANEMVITFLNGTKETDKKVRIAPLVP